MLRKLPKFLEENNAKLFIKYDGERKFKRYTILILFDNVHVNNVGNDTDFPCVVLGDLFEENGFFNVEEIVSFFENIINVGIENVKEKMGRDCIVSVRIEPYGGNSRYMLHIQTKDGTKHDFGEDFMQLVQKLLSEK